MAFEKDPDELGALWLKRGGKGPYMTGQINGVNVVCFATKDGGEGTKSPAWRVMKSKPKEQREPVSAGPAITDEDVIF